MRRSSSESEDGSYSRYVQVAEKSRVKQLKKQILEDLGLQEMCAIRLYHKNEMIVWDMDSVRDLQIDKVDVEVFITLHFSVAGKGSSYAISIDVNPNETLEIIRTRVTFYKMFN